jgi:branched-chain amino acid transport system substrate-binding protein
MIRLSGLALASASFIALATTAHAADRTVAVLQSLTGPAAFAGTAAVDGVKFAVEEVNAQKFLGGDTLKIIIDDDGTDRNQTTTALNRYARDPAILMVIGPTSAASALPAAAIANEQKLAIFSMTPASSVARSGPYGFIATQPAEATMPMLGDFMVNDLKLKNCALVNIIDNEAYTSLAGNFRAYVEPRGMKFVDVTGVKSADSDFSAVATRIVQAKPECIFMVTTPEIGSNLAIQLRQAGLDPNVKLIGHTAFASPALIKLGGKAVEGVLFYADWAPGGGIPSARAFNDAYKKAKGEEPGNFQAIGYNFVWVVAHAIKQAGANPTRESVRDALATLKDVPTVLGSGKFTMVDRMPTYGVNWLTVKDGKVVPLQR